MKFFTKLVACAAVVISVNALAADAGHKEAVLDTGKGGVRLTISVPDFAQGPYDFAKNDGIGKAIDDTWNHQEVMFNAAISDTGVIVYRSRLDKVNPAKTPKRLDAEGLARSQIETEGFEGRAVKISCPPAPIEGASIACYKMSGEPIFGTKTHNKHTAIVLAAISFASATQAYLLMGSATEKDAATYSANPVEIEKLAIGCFAQLYKKHKIQKN